MNLDTLRASLIKHEGSRNLPYEDTIGLQTLGVGHCLLNPISQAAIDQMLSDDIDTAVKELNKNFPGWKRHSDSRQNVLIELCFNMGAPRLKKFKKMWAALDLPQPDYAKAAAQLLDSQYAQQVGKRAITLAKQLEFGSRSDNT